jgi:D-alanyl-D-alanine carboxypeptidase
MIHRFRQDYVSTFLLYILAAVSGILMVVISHVPPAVILNTITPDTKKDTRVRFQELLFSDVQVKAKAFIVYDITNGTIIASKNGTTTLPLASITKVMTAVSARVHHDKTTQIKITPLSIDGGYDLGLSKNQYWSLDELLKYTLVFSSNDGALAIANNLGGLSFFLKQMNDDAKTLGLSLYFTDPAGLDTETTLGGEGSALDVAKLLAYAQKNFPELFDATTKKRVSVIASTGKLTGVPNTNQDINALTEALASKTGFTDEAGGNLAVIVDVTLGHPIAIVVLGSTKEDRFSDIKTLYTILKESIQK